MQKRIKHIPFCLLFMTLTMQVFAQPFTFRTWSLSEGLPQSQVLCTYVDRQGYLWVSTNGGGLCRFDGKQFNVYRGHNNLFVSRPVYSLFQDEDNRLYAGGESGIRIKRDTFYATYLPPPIDVRAICAYNDSLILLGGNTGLAWYSRKSERVISFPNDSIRDVMVLHASGGSIWAGTKKGLWKINTKNHQTDFLGKMIGQGIYAIATRDEHSIWLASWGAGIVLYNDALQKIDTVIRHEQVLLPQCLYYAPGEQLWIGTQNHGLIHLDLAANKLTTYGEAEGLPHLNVKTITPYQRDEFWVGTSGGGLVFASRQNFRQYDKSDGLAFNRVYDLATDEQDHLWLAAGNTIQEMDRQVLRTYHIDTLTQGAKCKTILKDRLGRTWIGTEGKGIVVMTESKSILIDHRDGLPDNYIQKLDMDLSGKVFAATFTNGLCTVEIDSADNVKVTDVVLPFKQITALYFDQLQRGWAGSIDGQLAIRKPGETKWIKTGTYNIPKVAIRSITVDSFDRVWLGTQNQGLYFSPDEISLDFQISPLNSVLNSQNIYLLFAHPDHTLWVGTEKGVDKLTFTEDGNFRDITYFGRNEGFTGIETCHDAVTLDQKGNLWFGTMNGLMQYTPGNTSITNPPPKLHFENISLFYEPLSETKYASMFLPQAGLAPNASFDHKDNHLNFTFKGIDLAQPDEVLYRWRLEGVEDRWSPPSTQTNVNYASLRPGSYTLLVQAATDTTKWSDPIATSFTIETPYWQTVWFKIGISALGLGLLLVISSLWTRNIRKREAAKRKQLEIENNLLQLEQKALQLQMNPHFLFNALTSIKSLVGKAQLEEAQEEINAFAQLMRGVLNNSRKAYISLAEEIRVLDKYLHMEQLCHQHKFQYKIEVAAGLDPEEIEIPPMLIQPFVENAVVHGVSHLQHEGLIEVVFEKESDLLVCKIKDNGIGRERALRLREEKKPGHQPVAVEVTRERLEALRNGQAYVPLVTEDMLNERQEISGTLVILRLPIRVNW